MQKQDFVSECVDSAAITIKIIMAHYGEHIFNWENAPQGNQIMLEASTDLGEQRSTDC